MKHDDGGPAFPQAPPNVAPGECYSGPAAEPGMTLLAYFAANVPEGHLAHFLAEPKAGSTRADWGRAQVKARYDYADAMIAEMRKREARGPDSADDNPTA